MNESCEPSTNLGYLLRSSQVWGLRFGVVVGGFFKSGCEWSDVERGVFSEVLMEGSGLSRRYGLMWSFLRCVEYRSDGGVDEDIGDLFGVAVLAIIIQHTSNDCRDTHIGASELS